MKAAESLSTESLGYQMGFARCAKIPRDRSAKSIAHFQREMAVRALAAPVLAPQSKSKPSASSQSCATPLLDMENAEKQKWVKRLKAIADRAGEHSGHEGGPQTDGILCHEEKSRLGLLVFTSGAPSTMSNHIRRFEVFELWAQRMQISFYPITDEKILKYAVELDARECGPTVLPSLRTALKWVAFRINLKLPSIETAEIKALEKEVFTQRGKPLKEAIAFPIELVQAMERFVANPAHPVPARVFRWVLCMIFASSALTMRSTSSPTRSRSSPTVSSAFLGKPRGRGSAEEPSSWSRKSPSPMCLGLKQVLTCSICSSLYLVERDFWVPELDARDRWRATPPDYARSLQWLHHLVWRAGQEAGVAKEILARSFEAVVHAGGDASLENPLSSLIWQVPQMQQLKVRLHLYNLDFDQCQFGSPHKKPTRLLTSHAALLALARHCQGGHVHDALQGAVRTASGKKIFQTKHAQVYPLPLSLGQVWAQVVATVVHSAMPQLQASFELAAPAQDRKRALGSNVPWKRRRQFAAAELAAASGYQLKRGAAKPLLDIECEPGQAIQWSLNVVHPFTVQPPLPSKILQNIKFIVSSPEALIARRGERLQFWQQRVLDLLPQTDRELRAISDPSLRRLLRGVPDYVDLQLGSCTHVALYDEFFSAIDCQDRALANSLRSGFPIVGEIQRSGRWPQFQKPQRPVPVQEALSRAREMRAKVFRRCKSVPESDNLRSLWNATLEDEKEGSKVGLLGSEEEVSKFLGCADWIPTQRFEVVQESNRSEAVTVLPRI